MNIKEIVKYINEIGRSCAARDGAAYIDCDATGKLSARLAVSDDRLTVTVELPTKVGPLLAQDILTAICTANSFANFGCFMLSPAEQTIVFRGYVLLRGDVRGEVAYLLGALDRAMTKFVPLLLAVCDGSLAADAFGEACMNKK